MADTTEKPYTIADQAKRHAKALSTGNQRVLNIDALYQPDYLAGKTVLITGGNRGLGRAIAQECARQGAHVIVTVRTPVALDYADHVISAVDVTNDDCGDTITSYLHTHALQVDILINNAGYFAEPLETLDTLDCRAALKMFDVCALGPLRVSAALIRNGLISSGGRIAMITSQGGSITWRTTQNPTGHDYGHHMSKAAANMMGVLLAQEIKSKAITVAMLHPGFNKTDMTQKYEDIWDQEGAVAPEVGAKRVLHEIGQLTLDKTGDFINCEDGLAIPW